MTSIMFSKLAIREALQKIRDLKGKKATFTMIKSKYLNNDLLPEEERWHKQREQVDYWEARRYFHELGILLGKLITLEVEVNEEGFTRKDIYDEFRKNCYHNRQGICQYFKCECHIECPLFKRGAEVDT